LGVLKITENTLRRTILFILLGLIVVWIFLLPVMINLVQFFEFKDSSNRNFETSFPEGIGGLNLNIYITHQPSRALFQVSDYFIIRLKYNTYTSENVSSLGFYEITLKITVEPDREAVYPVINTYYYNLEDNPIYISKAVSVLPADDVIIEGSAKISFNNNGIILNETIPYEYIYTILVSGKEIDYNLSITKVWGWFFYIVSLIGIISGILKILSVPDPKTRALQEKKRQERDFLQYLKKREEEKT